MSELCWSRMVISRAIQLYVRRMPSSATRAAPNRERYASDCCRYRAHERPRFVDVLELEPLSATPAMSGRDR